jgi:hypothetical protein
MNRKNLKRAAGNTHFEHHSSQNGRTACIATTFEKQAIFANENNPHEYALFGKPGLKSAV